MMLFLLSHQLTGHKKDNGWRFHEEVTSNMMEFTMAVENHRKEENGNKVQLEICGLGIWRK